MPSLKLEDIRTRCEALQSALAEETYESGAGLKNESNVSRIYKQYADVVSKEAIEVVRRALEDPLRQPDAEEERRLRYLHEHLVHAFAAAEVRYITDEVLTRESEARIRLGEGPNVEEIAFRKTQVEIANTGDRPRREALEMASIALVDEWNPILAERLGIERGIARTFGHDTYTALWQAVTGIDLAKLDQQMQGFLARTEDMYREAMGWVVRKRLTLPLEDARRHDLHWIFRAEEFDDFFPKGDMLPVAGRFLSEMGVDITAAGNVGFDLEPRERKRARAFCAAIDVPRRVMLVLSPGGGRRDWQQLMHELGHALHTGYTSSLEPYEFRRLGDASVMETYAFLFQYLLVDRGWLKRNLGMTKPKDFLFLANLEKLTYLRRYAAKLHYEIALHGGENGVEGKDELYEQNMLGALKVGYPKELFLYDVDRAFYVARYVRAWLFEALLSKHLVHYFDEDWYRNPRTGQFLKKHWVLGNRFGVEEMAKEIGYSGLDTAPLEEDLQKAL